MASLSTKSPSEYIHELIHNNAVEETVQQIFDGQVQVPALSSSSGSAIGSVNVTMTAEASHTTSLTQFGIAPKQSRNNSYTNAARYQLSPTGTGTSIITSRAPGSSLASSATLSATISVVPFKTIVSESKSSPVDSGDLYADLSGCGNRYINCGARSGIGLK